MKFNFMYSTPCIVAVIDNTGGHWCYNTVFDNVQEAFNFTEDIFNGYTAWDSSTVDVIYITDKNTGEILVECSHDKCLNAEYDDEGNTICPHEWDDVACEDCEIQKSCNL